MDKDLPLIKITTSQLRLGLFVPLLMILSLAFENKMALHITTAIFGTVAFLAYKVIRSINPQGWHYTDITFIFLLFVSLDVLSIAFMALFGLQYGEPIFSLSRDLNLLSKTVLAYAIFIGVFILASSLVIRGKVPEPSLTPLYTSHIWVLIAISLITSKFVFDYFILGRSLITWGAVLEQPRPFLVGGQLYRILSLANSSAVVFLIGIWISRTKTLYQARLRLLFLAIFYLAISFAFTTERGHVLYVLIGSAVFCEGLRWKGRFVSGKVVIWFIVSLMTANAITNLLEFYIYAKYIPDIANLPMSRFFTFHPNPIFVGGEIIRWVDEGIVAIWNGQIYLDAIRVLVPAQFLGERVVDMSKWFVFLFNPIAAERGAGMGFSSVGEGYLNFGMPGVAVEGFILGLLAGLIRWLRYTRKLGTIRLFLYASTVGLSIGFYRFGVQYILDSLVLKVLVTVGLLTVAKIMLGAGRPGLIVRRTQHVNPETNLEE